MFLFLISFSFFRTETLKILGLDPGNAFCWAIDYLMNTLSLPHQVLSLIWIKNSNLKSIQCSSRLSLVVLCQWMKYKNVFSNTFCIKVTLEGEGAVGKIDLELSLPAKWMTELWIETLKRLIPHAVYELPSQLTEIQLF